MEQELSDRLTRIETLIDNHLKHHEMWMKFLLAPILVGVILTFILTALNMVF